MKQRYCAHCQAPIGQQANFCGQCAQPNPPRILTRSLWFVPLPVIIVALGCFWLSRQQPAAPVKVAVAPTDAPPILPPTDAPPAVRTPAPLRWANSVNVDRAPTSSASRKDGGGSDQQSSQMTYEQAQNGGCGSDENIHTPRDYANMLKCELQAAKTIDELRNYKGRWEIFESSFQSDLDAAVSDEQTSRMQITKLRIMHDITQSMIMAAETKIQSKPEAVEAYVNHAYALVAIWEIGNP